MRASSTALDGVDDDARGTLGQHGLKRTPEERRAGAAWGQRHDDRASADVLGLLDHAPPGLAGLTFSQWPVTRRPPRTRAESITDDAFASCSGIEASIGEFVGTVIVTSTWMPRRRRAASRTAVEIASGE